MSQQTKIVLLLWAVALVTIAVALSLGFLVPWLVTP